MNTYNLPAAFQDLIALTEQSLTLAKRGEWLELEENEKVRSRSLREIFDQVISEDLAEPARHTITQIRALEEEINALARTGQRDVAKELKTFQQHSKAHKAYQQP